jgi:hypothetical protein
MNAKKTLESYYAVFASILGLILLAVIAVGFAAPFLGRWIYKKFYAKKDESPVHRSAGKGDPPRL